MFDHVTIRPSDRRASEAFYSTVLASLGIEQTHGDEALAEWDDFSLAPTGAGHPVTRRLHVGFAAPSHEHVRAFWEAGTAAGYRDDGAPGPRPRYGDDYYGGFLLDPDGNSAEAVHHGDLRTGGWIDHLWIRVADVGRSQPFYEILAAHAGFELRTHGPDHLQVRGVTGSFSLLRGTPTEHVHMAFPVRDNLTVDAFHRATIEAGYHDHGAPGERPAYHAGYYGAYILDPDGNNVELVNHSR